MLGYLVRNINDMELSVVSVERILEYMHCPQEVTWTTKTMFTLLNLQAAWHSPVGQGPPRGWPVEGSIRFQKFSCRYRPGLELSLRSITAEIRPWEKVRTIPLIRVLIIKNIGENVKHRRGIDPLPSRKGLAT